MEADQSAQMAEGGVSATPEEAGTVEEEGVTRSIIDLILETDFTTYLPEWMQAGWESIHDFHVVVAVLIVLMGYGIGRLLKWLIHMLLSRMSKSEEDKLDYEIAHNLASPILQTSVAFSIVVAIVLFHFPEVLEWMLIRLCFTTLVVLWGRAWFRATEAILKSMEHNSNRSHMFQGRALPLYEMGIKVLLMGLFIYMLLHIWGIDATAWIASAGIIGIAVGFAARDTIANLISGVSIVADAPYKIGDYIVLDTGERGMVTNLGIRSTRLLSRDDVEVSIPNAVIGGAKIVNESGGPWVRHRIRIPVGVAYSSDINKVIEVLKGIADEHEKVTDMPEPRVRLRRFGDSSIDMELLCWIRVPSERGVVIHELMLATIERFREENIEIPFPQRDLHMKDGAPEDALD